MENAYICISFYMEYMMKVLVIFAVEREVVDIKIPGCEVKIVLSGVGKARAAMTAMKGLIEYKPDIVISVGTAGTLNHRVGDIFVCRHIIDRDFYKAKEILGLPCEVVVPETDFMKSFPSIVSGERVNRTDFTVSCGDNFVTDGENNGEDVVDMESFAEYCACEKEGVPFFAVKYVTDVIGQNSVDIWENRLASAREALQKYFEKLDF